MRAVFALLVLVAAVGCSSTPERDSTRGPDPIVATTFNIFHAHGADGRVDLDRVAEVIRSSGADLVGLQEVDRHFDSRSAFADQATVLGETLGMHVAFAPTVDLPPATDGAPRRQYGNALLSRFPIESTVVKPLPTGEVTEPRVALSATIDAPGGGIDVVVTHLDNGASSDRAGQARAVVALVGAEPRRTIVLVDANDGPRSAAVRILTTSLRDAWRAGTGAGATAPAVAPTRRIDYVLVSADLRIRSAWVPVTDASDHRPVVATVSGR